MQSRLPRGRGVCRGAEELARLPGGRRALPLHSRRFRLGLQGESSGLWLGKDDGQRRAPAGTVGWSQIFPLEVLRAELGSSRHWAQGHFRFISASPREPAAELAVVRRDENPSYGGRVRWLGPDSERSMAEPPRRGGLAPRLPSAFPGLRGDAKKARLGRRSVLMRCPSPVCLCHRSARAGPRDRRRCRSLDGMWCGGQGGRAERRCKGRERSGGRREGPARPRGRCCAVPAPPGPRAGGSSGRLELRRRQCPRDGAVQREGTGTGRAGGPGRGPQERPWARLPPRWSPGQAERPEPSPVGSARPSSPDPASWQCGLQPPPRRDPELPRRCWGPSRSQPAGRCALVAARDLCPSRQYPRAVGRCPPGPQRAAPGNLTSVRATALSPARASR